MVTLTVSVMVAVICACTGFGVTGITDRPPMTSVVDTCVNVFAGDEGDGVGVGVDVLVRTRVNDAGTSPAAGGNGKGEGELWTVVSCTSVAVVVATFPLASEPSVVKPPITPVNVGLIVAKTMVISPWEDGGWSPCSFPGAGTGAVTEDGNVLEPSIVLSGLALVVGNTVSRPEVGDAVVAGGSTCTVTRDVSRTVV